ncbi:MAG: CPBP family intramembrane metalloprotease [Nitriliruptorales bacterium]|nr:CPBP family intramembrane metalloprotease [Nitriliruptorales bacterium]
MQGPTTGATNEAVQPPGDTRWPGNLPPGVGAASGVGIAAALVAFLLWPTGASDDPAGGLVFHAVLLFTVIIASCAILLSRGHGFVALLGWPPAIKDRGLWLVEPGLKLVALQLLLVGVLTRTVLDGPGKAIEPGGPAPQPSWPVFILSAVLLLAGHPLAEELLFRGLLLGGLLRKWAPDGQGVGVALAVLSSALIFGLAHGVTGASGWLRVIPATFMGAGLGLLAVHDRGLTRPIIAHALVNLAAVFVELRP